MQELADEYRKSLELLNGRVAELKQLQKKLEAQSSDPAKDPDALSIKERLKPLIAMQKDLGTLEKEIRNYYDRSWWRSTEFTCNSKVGVILRFAPLVNNKTCETVHPCFSESFQTSKA